MVQFEHSIQEPRLGKKGSFPLVTELKTLLVMKLNKYYNSGDIYTCMIHNKIYRSKPRSIFMSVNTRKSTMSKEKE